MCFGQLNIVTGVALILAWASVPPPTLALAGNAPAAEVTGTPTVYKTVDGQELKLYIVKPADWKAADKRPAMVFFHGGGWVSGTPAQFNEQSSRLAGRGMVCVQVQYRLLKANKNDPPLVCIQDAKSAMRWVRSHANDLGIDPARIAAAGGSAGGHLAAFVGMVEGKDDPQDDLRVSAKANALVLFNPVFDNGPENGWGGGRVGNRFKEFSPAHNITPDDPPAIVFLGTQDKLIPARVVERFKSNMEAVRVRCEVSLYEGQTHGFFNKEPWLSRTLSEADKFLTSLGWLESKP